MTILENLRVRTSELWVPFQATLELTYRCNERCGHCYLSTYDDREDGRPVLELHEWKSILDQLADVGTMNLVLIGGEALLSKLFWPLVEYASTKHFALSLISNGLLIDDAVAKKMQEFQFYQVSVSLYSLDSIIHDQMTQRRGSHARTIAAIENLRKHGVEVLINCLLTAQNIDTCFELEEWANARKVRIQFDPLVTAKNNGNLKSTGTRARLDQLKLFYLNLKQRGRGPTPQSVDLDDPICNAGRGKCAVNPYGDLLTCLEVHSPLGNLKTHSFQDLWHSSQAKKIRSRKNSDLKFDPTCGDGAFCDHCPGMAQAESEDALAAVPFLMEIAQIKRSVYEGC